MLQLLCYFIFVISFLFSFVCLLLYLCCAPAHKKRNSLILWATQFFISHSFFVLMFTLSLWLAVYIHIHVYVYIYACVDHMHTFLSTPIRKYAIELLWTKINNEISSTNCSFTRIYTYTRTYRHSISIELIRNAVEFNQFVVCFSLIEKVFTNYT